jgi:DNA-binding NarL/FixJ family response regulator
LLLVAAGRTDKAISLQLGLARRTVSNRVSEILLKLGAASRTEATAVALRAGLID